MRITTEEVFQAYLDCRRRKGNSVSASRFQSNLFENIATLTRELNDGSYQIGRSRCFVVTTPKPREVWAASFRDRIVHHVVYNRIGEKIERSFIANSCACIKGRGTHYGARRLERSIRIHSENWSKQLYYLKMDISNFFVSIQKDILWDRLKRRIDCELTARLAHQAIYHDPTTNYTFSGDKRLLELIPKHKSLFYAPWFMGLPIGCLSSQFNANVHMDVLDKYVVHSIKPLDYFRYVDDFILLDSDVGRLLEARDEITRVLWEKLLLEPNPSKTILNSVNQGVDFVGAVIKPWRTVPRKRLYTNAKAAIRNGASKESITSRLGLMGNYKSHYARAKACREALRTGYAANGGFNKVYGSPVVIRHQKNTG